MIVMMFVLAAERSIERLINSCRVLPNKLIADKNRPKYCTKFDLDL